MNPTDQIGIPVAVTGAEIVRKKTLGDALSLCAEVAGFDCDKKLQDALGFDKGQFSRWQSGGEGIVWPKFVKLMDFCGNDAPLLWMVHQRGYDIGSLRRLETELQRQLRIKNEALEKAEAENKLLRDLLTGRAA